MIGYVGTGSSFGGCIRYCLEDKKELTEEQKLELSLKDNLQHKNRAEILEYNLCFGDAKELAQQCIEVAKLSKRVEKPVFHFSLHLAPGDTLTRVQLIEIGRECAKEFGVAEHQYISILHKDTNEQHIHIVANRVGLNGKVASDSNSYKRMAALCRRLEKQFQLQEVLSPRAFLSKEQRLIPRHDSRKERLKENIRQTLQQSKNYKEFEQKMKSLGYQVLKGRGIAFIDNKKVKIKGSEVGFSLAKIEKILHLKQDLAAKQAEQKIREIAVRKEDTKHVYTPVQKMLRQTAEAAQREKSEVSQLEKQIEGLLYELFKPVYADQYINPELLKEAKPKRKRQKPKL